MSYDHVIDEATTRRIVHLIDTMPGDDPERVHNDIDTILLDIVPDPISEAVGRAIARCGWWASA